MRCISTGLATIGLTIVVAYIHPRRVFVLLYFVLLHLSYTLLLLATSRHPIVKSDPPNHAPINHRPTQAPKNLSSLLLRLQRVTRHEQRELRRRKSVEHALRLEEVLYAAEDLNAQVNVDVAAPRGVGSAPDAIKPPIQRASSVIT